MDATIRWAGFVAPNGADHLLGEHYYNTAWKSRRRLLQEAAIFVMVFRSLCRNEACAGCGFRGKGAGLGV